MVETPQVNTRRDQVYETAARLFSDLGYDAVDLKLIADAAGLPSSELVDLVGDKPTLYLDVFTWLHSSSSAPCRPPSRTSPRTPPGSSASATPSSTSA